MPFPIIKVREIDHIVGQSGIIGYGRGLQMVSIRHTCIHCRRSGTTGAWKSIDHLSGESRLPASLHGTSTSLAYLAESVASFTGSFGTDAAAFFLNRVALVTGSFDHFGVGHCVISQSRNNKCVHHSSTPFFGTLALHRDDSQAQSCVSVLLWLAGLKHPL